MAFWSLRRPVAGLGRLTVLAGLPALAAFLWGGCAKDDHPSLLARAGQDADSPKVAVCRDGEKVACGLNLGSHKGIVSCYEGTQLCRNGVLGPCEDGQVVNLPAPESTSPGQLQTQALSTPSSCAFNPCDPDCQLYSEQPDSPMGSGQGFSWQGGADTQRAAGYHEPCRSGADCQFNSQCTNVVTENRCAHDKCDDGAPLAANCDPCVARVCAEDSTCCDRPCGPDEVAGPNLSSCYYVSGNSESVVRTAARTQCQARGPGWDLAVIDSGVENNFLASLLTSRNTGSAWHGLKELPTPNTWAWLDGSALAATAYTNWASGEPGAAADEPCAILEPGGSWRDYNCGNSFRYLCEGPSAPATTCAHEACVTGGPLKASCDPCVAQICATDPSCCNLAGGQWSDSCAAKVGTICGRTCDCAPDEKARGHNCYYLHYGFASWPAARTQCQARGQGWDLVTIQSATENQFVRDLTLPNEGYRLWMGLTDEGHEGDFRWVDGSPADFVPWADGEPNNAGGENCGVMWNDDGEWNDFGCQNTTSYVCKGPSKSTKAWAPSCVDRIKSACDATCTPPEGLGTASAGECRAWRPGEEDSQCNLPDLAVGIPCGSQVPICNHGTKPAPTGIEVAVLPKGSGQYPACDPNLAGPGITRCQTTEPIPPGGCINLTGCSGVGADREIVVNPPGPARVAECSCLDNWGLSTANVACQVPTCSAQTTTGSLRKLNLFFAVDRAGALTNSPDWTGTVTALQSFFSAPSSTGIQVALEFFPLASGGDAGDGCYGTGTCDAAPCAAPMVALGPLTAASGAGDLQETALLSALALSAPPPSGSTPTSAALEGALNWATSRPASPDEINVVVLVGGGQPDRCVVDPGSLSRLAANAYQNGVRTFTVGMGQDDRPILQAIAQAGGGQHFTLQSGNPTTVAQGLSQALNAIATHEVACSLPAPSQVDWDQTRVAVSYSVAGGPPVSLSQTAPAAPCTDGWRYDDPMNPSQVTLCTNTCNTLRAASTATVRAEFPCRAGKYSRRYVEVYEGQCPEQRKVQWGFTTWDTSTPNGATVTFSAQTASTKADLRTSDVTVLGTASQDAHTDVCDFASTCYVDLYAKLGTVKAQHQFLRLIMDASPNSAGTADASLNNWKVTYSCPQAE